MTAVAVAGAVMGVVGVVLPRHVPGWLGATLAVVALAGLDLAGAVLASRWSTTREPLAFLLGLAAFGLLFVVYARGLSFATLTTVTLGWVVLLQVGVVVIDQVQRGAFPATDRLVVIAGLLALQGYLVLTGPPSH